MSQRILTATFDHEDDLLRAVAAARDGGLQVVDAFTPYAVHGLDRAMGWKPSRLPWVCFAFGMLGALGMLWFEHWSLTIDWPVNIGGKTWNSLPSYVPVAFEAAVLLAGFASVFALLAVCRLFPGKHPRLLDSRATDDRFVLVIEETDASFNVEEVKRLMMTCGAVEAEERTATEGGLS